MDILIGSENGQLQTVKFEKFSVNTSISSTPEINLAVLPVETASGTGYPPVKFSLLCGNLLWLARDNGAIEAFSVSEQKLTEMVVFPFPENCSIVGLFALENDQIMAVSNLTQIATWSQTDLTVTLKKLSGVAEIQAAAKLGNYLAVGGKGSKNNLKVFNLTDLEKGALYTAKATTNTRLNVPFNVDIRAVCFTSLQKPEHLAVANADGQIFLYDFSRQSSSILHHQVLPKKSALTSLARAEKDGCVVYTDVSGVIECYDLLKGRSYGRFKPQEGAVQSFLLTGNDSIIITASKDRFLRIFNYKTRSLLHKVYLKHVPKTLTLTAQEWLKAHSQQYEDSEDEEVWEGMTPVQDKKKRTKVQESNE